jgi:hypothetical protein
VLAITQWVEDQRDWLLAQGFGRRVGAKALPAQATLYRFVWALEQQVSALEEALKAWALEVLKVLNPAHPGQMVVNLDGKYLKAPAGGWGFSTRMEVGARVYTPVTCLPWPLARPKGKKERKM